MKQKKLFIILFIFTLLVATLSGCKKEETTDTSNDQQTTNEATTSDSTSDSQSETATNDPVELIITWWGNQTRNERTQQIIDQYVESHPNVAIDGQFAEWADYWNKLSTASAGRMLPDIVQMDYKYLEQYVSNDLLTDLTPYINDGTIDVANIDPNIVNIGKIGDGIYGLSLGMNAPALMYNKTLLDSNGITVKDNMTIQEFIDVCKEVYEKTGYKTDMAYGNGDIFIEYILRSMDALLYDSNKIGATQEQLQEFFSLYEQGIAEGWMCSPEIYTERTIGTPEQMPLVYGSSPDSMSWCSFTYSNALTALQNAAGESVEIAMTTWPADDPVKANYLKPSMFFAISVDSENPEVAADFISNWTNSLEANAILLAERGVPIANTVQTDMVSKMDENNQEIFAYIQNVVTPNSSTINPPAPSGSAEVLKLVDQLVEAIAYQTMTSSDAATELLEKGNAILSK